MVYPHTNYAYAMRKRNLCTIGVGVYFVPFYGKIFLPPHQSFNNENRSPINEAKQTSFLIIEILLNTSGIGVGVNL